MIHNLLQMNRNLNCIIFKMYSTGFYLNSKQVSKKANAAEANSSVTTGNGWTCVRFNITSNKVLIPWHSKLYNLLVIRKSPDYLAWTHLLSMSEERILIANYTSGGRGSLQRSPQGSRRIFICLLSWSGTLYIGLKTERDSLRTSLSKRVAEEEVHVQGCLRLWVPWVCVCAARVFSCGGWVAKLL